MQSCVLIKNAPRKHECFNNPFLKLMYELKVRRFEVLLCYMILKKFFVIYHTASFLKPPNMMVFWLRRICLCASGFIRNATHHTHYLLLLLLLLWCRTAGMQNFSADEVFSFMIGICLQFFLKYSGVFFFHFKDF